MQPPSDASPQRRVGAQRGVLWLPVQDVLWLPGPGRPDKIKLTTACKLGVGGGVWREDPSFPRHAPTWTEL